MFLDPVPSNRWFKKVQVHCFWSRGIRTFLAWYPRCMWQLDIAPAMDRWRLPKWLGWHFSPCTRSVLILHLKAFFQLQSYREKTNSAHTLTNSLIPIPLPQHQHTFCQRRCFDQDCPGHRQVEMNKMKSASFCSFRPDEDQGNPGRNVVSDKKVCRCWGRGIGIIMTTQQERTCSQIVCSYKVEIWYNETCFIWSITTYFVCERIKKMGKTTVILKIFSGGDPRTPTTAPFWNPAENAAHTHRAYG